MLSLTWLRDKARAAVDLLLLQRKAWRHAGHVLAYAGLLGLAAWLNAPLKHLDWALVDRFDSRSAPWPAGLEVVDLGWNMDPGTLEGFRGNLAAALNALAALRVPPRIVVVDVTLSTVPLGLETLQEAVQSLAGKPIQVIAVADVSTFGPAGTRLEGLNRQGATAVYGGSKWFGHSAMEFAGNSYWYRPCLALEMLPPEECLPAVPLLVGAKVQQPRREDPPVPTDWRPVLFQPGSDQFVHCHTWTLRDGALVPLLGGNCGAGELSHAVVIVGNLTHDRVNGRPGPEVLAWAIGAHVAPSPPDAPRLVALTELPWTLGFTLGFSALALVVFALLTRAASHPERHLAVISLASAALTLAALAALVLLLRHELYVVYPQVSFVAVAVLMTVGLAWHALRGALRERALYTDVAGPAGSVEPTWDVFISYSHTPSENMAWVERELYQALASARLGDRPLQVFFDKKTIRIGTAWYFELAEAIERSRCVIAVYSSDYFSKNFCNFELGKAAVRDIVAKGQGFAIVPVMRGVVSVPPAFRHLQFMPAGESRAMVDEVLRKLQLPPVSG